MKPKILTAIILGVFCCPLYALHLTFHYSLSELSFVNDTTEYGVFVKTVWKDAFNGAEDVGMPELPAFYHTVQIADNIIVDTVKITLSNGISDFLAHPLMPHQQPIPTGYPIEEPQFIKNERVYQKNDVLPHNNLIDYRVDQARDGNFLSLTIAPIQYNPATNAYTAYSEVEVEVLTHEEDSRLRATRRAYRDIGIPFYEYVIITSAQLAPAFEPFAEWKRAKGYDVGIVHISDILNNPNLEAGDTITNVADNAGKLRQYLIYSYNAVQTKYVLLGGDYTVVPIRYARAYHEYEDTNHNIIHIDTINIPSDFYYAELNSDWDTNNNGILEDFFNISEYYGDNIDYGAEVYVGRLLCTEVEEVKNWTKKVLQYEINPGNGDYSYLGEALITQSDHMQSSYQAESIRQQLQGNLNVSIFSETPSYIDSFPSFPKGADVITALNNTHYGLYSNFNHGGPLNYGTATYLCAGNGHDVHWGVSAMDDYDEHDELLNSSKPETGNGFDNLTNTKHPSIMYSTSCKNMPFDQYLTPNGTYNLGRVFTCRSNGGGPAYLGNTRDGWISESIKLYRYFLNQILGNQHINHLGIAEALSKSYTTYSFNIFYKNYLLHSHNLLGCPEMSLYTRIPSTFDNVVVNYTNNHMTVSTGITDSVECRICLAGIVDGAYRQFVYTDRSNVTFDTIPETYTLVVSMPNYIPYVWTNNTCFLQNQGISNSRTYNGCDIFTIGSDINPIQPYGNVSIENGGNVEINVGDKVIIQNDFEVKLGGQLLIH